MLVGNRNQSWWSLQEEIERTQCKCKTIFLEITLNFPNNSTVFKMIDELYFYKCIIQFNQTGKKFFPTGTSDSRIVLCDIYYIYVNKKSLKIPKG